jgi:acyl-CoA reductase-like NAD-dependent aldehyde dehydrogenase
LEAQLIIGGTAIAPSNGATYDRLDPVTGAVATRAAAATDQDARAAADAAATAFPEWSAFGPGKRRTVLLAAADALAGKADAFVEAMRNEVGATEMWARFNVALGASILREAASMTTQIGGEVIPSDKPGALMMGVRQPAGVVLGIAPWNAPVILGVRAIAMPLACGNTVVLKASEACPKTHLLIAEALVEAGIPAGVVNAVTNRPEDASAVVNALIDHPAVRRVNFTGSTKVGRLIAEACARQLKPCLLELGGKAPLIVLDDADVDAAVDAAAFGAFMNQGQICMATERIIVDEKVADAFVAKLAAKCAAFPTGTSGPVVIGSMVDASAAARIEGLVQDAMEQGGIIAAGGSGPSPSVHAATVVDGLTPSMRLYKEESFGPVVGVIRVKSIDEAVQIANDTDYGLSSAVFGRDVTRAMAVAKRIQSGICHINGPTVQDEPQMPFGGVKDSGFGRFGGKAAINEFTDLRWISIENEQHYPF